MATENQRTPSVQSQMMEIPPINTLEVVDQGHLSYTILHRIIARGNLEENILA